MTRTQPEAALIREAFERSGCVRVPNPARRRRQPRSYKKGYEVRISVPRRTELVRLRQALRTIGFTCGRPYHKSGHLVQPIYGRDQVIQFLDLVGLDMPQPDTADAVDDDRGTA